MVSSKRDIGSAGESLAETYLISRGYVILGKNMTSRRGEVDLVVRKGKMIFFVEVKRRLGTRFGSAIQAVSSKKQHRIRKTAEYLLLKNPSWRDFIPFFSVLAIDEDTHGKIAIEFLPDAFV